MEYKTYSKKSYNIHTIKTSKFKTVKMEIFFSANISKDEMPTYAFLADLMSDTSKKYPTRKDISVRLEELYKSEFYSSTSKVGSLFTISFILDFINPAYIEEKDYLENVLTFPFEIISNPNVNNKEFDINYFNIIKRRMKEDIESIKESSDRYSLINALKAMDKNSFSSYRVLGDLDSLENITPRSLYDAYEKMMNNFNCDIFIIGNIDNEKYVNIIDRSFKNNIIKVNNPVIYVNNKIKSKPTKVIEESNFIQSTLVMIYNITSLSKHNKDISFHVFNYILGSGGLNSKLYDYLRNKNSLCYGVRSIYLKYDGLLVVLVSLDKKNVKKGEILIKKAINEMKKGIYEEDDVENAKKNLVFSLKLSLDNNNSILNNYVFNYLDNLPLLEERIDLIKSVLKKDLIECGKSLKLNTVYVLDSGDSNERN